MAYKEDDIVRNDKGDELILKNGQWVPHSATAGQPKAPDISNRVGFPKPNRPDVSGGAPWTAQAKAAFVDDPETKAKIYADAMFPDDPDRYKRFGFKDGEVIYRDKGWNLNYARPGGLLGGLKNFSAEQPAYLPHEVMGTVGAASGQPWLAALGVAGGEAWRKLIGNLIFDEPQTPVGNAMDITQTGLLGGYGPAKLGQWVGKGLQRGVVRDIDNVDLKALRHLDDTSKQTGIPLTVAEKTDLGSLKGYQTALNNITDSADDMARFYANRNKAIGSRVAKTLDDISPIDSAEDAAGLAVKATQSAKDKISQQMKTKAAPLYKKAYESGPVDISTVIKGMDDDIARFPKNGKIARGLTKAKRYLMKETDEGLVPNDSLESLDYAKQEIDDLIESAKRQGNNRLVARLTQNKNALLTHMDEVSPDYKIARQIWTEGMDALDKVDSTAVKVIANLPEEKYQTAAVRMFNPKTTGPNAVRKAKNIIAKEDPEAWNGLVRSYIESAWQDAGDVASGTRGYTFKRMIFGMSPDSKKAATLKAAMEPKQFKAFSDLMDVLDATGRVKQVGSDTAYKQEIIKELNEKWGSGWDDISRPIGWVREKLGRARIGKNAKKMAEILTTQDGIESIKLIKQLPPGSQASINALSVLFGVNMTGENDVSAPDTAPQLTR